MPVPLSEWKKKWAEIFFLNLNIFNDSYCVAILAINFLQVYQNN